MAASKLLVYVWGGESWKTVFQEQILTGAPDDPSGILSWPVQGPSLAVSTLIFPSPKGRRALLMIGNHDVAPGIGIFENSLIWISLPPGAPPAGRQDWPRQEYKNWLDPTPEARFAVDRPSPASRKAEHLPEQGPKYSTRASSLNSYGLSAHKKGNYERAAWRFYQSLSFDPNHSVSRYNLACTLSRMGQPRRALAQLEQLFSDCPECQEHREHARSDADFELLRVQEKFQKLVCQSEPGCVAALMPRSLPSQAPVQVSGGVHDSPLEQDFLVEVSSKKKVSNFFCSHPGAIQQGPRGWWHLLSLLVWVPLARRRAGGGRN